MKEDVALKGLKKGRKFFFPKRKKKLLAPKD